MTTGVGRHVTNILSALTRMMESNTIHVIVNHLRYSLNEIRLHTYFTTENMSTFCTLCEPSLVKRCI
ncbi:hypothetical protein EMIT0180MI3_60103 [Priestia megaterium]